MYDINMDEFSVEFAWCWQAAGLHLQQKAQGCEVAWLKVELTPPFLEHLSLRVGNQLFFIRLEDVDGALEIPGSRQGVRFIAEGCKGHACLMPMRNEAGAWKPAASGWGLIDETDGRAIDPPSLDTQEKIEMTDWEVQDLAVQVVREHIRSELKHEVMSSQGTPGVDPSLWFVGEHGPEWVVVRAVRFPAVRASLPDTMRDIAQNCAALSPRGHFASVAVTNYEDSTAPSGPVGLPLWRGEALEVDFPGLEPYAL